MNTKVKHKMKPTDLSAELRNLLCSDRTTIKEALDYFFDVARSVGAAERGALIIAMGVVLNTIANEIDKLEV